MRCTARGDHVVTGHLRDSFPQRLWWKDLRARPTPLGPCRSGEVHNPTWQAGIIAFILVVASPCDFCAGKRSRYNLAHHAEGQRLMHVIPFLVALILIVAPVSQTNAQKLPATHTAETAEQRDARMRWWREARFGMFIHWGIYSVPAGTYQGKPIAGIGEW